jgi:hypothetical protein
MGVLQEPAFDIHQRDELDAGCAGRRSQSRGKAKKVEQKRTNTAATRG